MIAEPGDVLAALECPELVPHETDDPSDGPTIGLRRSMARFSSGPEHTVRRVSVETAVSSIDVRDAARVARFRARLLLARGELDVLALAAHAPVATLGQVLGVERPDELVADVESIVSVIGRSRPADIGADAATTRVLDRFAGRPEGPVAWASVLYQAMDATAALIATRVLAAATNAPAVPAVPRTRRRAIDDVEVGAHRLGADAEVSIEIGAAGFPFGAGPHACPGRELAVAIAEAIVAEIDAGRVDLTSVMLDADRRPTRLRLVPPDRAPG